MESMTEMDYKRTCIGYVPVKIKIMASALWFVFGVCMGVLSKALDTTASNELPQILQMMDVRNFLGRFAVWIFIAVCISVYSSSPGRAAWNVFLFFLGMVSAYYLYSALAAGFFPTGYALIWFGITAVSPLLAYFCWHARREGWLAAVISGVIVGALFSQAILLLQGIRIAHVPELILWLASIVILRRKLKEFAVMLFISVLTAVVIQSVLPYWG